MAVSAERGPAWKVDDEISCLVWNERCGRLLKKDRVLFYQPREMAAIAWLKRQRFKVEGPLPDVSATMQSSLSLLFMTL